MVAEVAEVEALQAEVEALQVEVKPQHHQRQLQEDKLHLMVRQQLQLRL